MNGSKLAAGRAVRAVLSVALALAGAVMAGMNPASAQQTKAEKKLAATERTVEGTVADADGKFIEGAVVFLKDVRTTQVRSFYTQKNGAYHFAGLKIDDDYDLKAKHNEKVSDWKRLSIFDTRKAPVINLTLDKSEKTETKQ